MNEKKYFLMFLCLLAVFFLISCSGSPDFDTMLPDLPLNVTEYNYEDWTRINVDERYVLNANPWNAELSPYPYAQSIFLGDEDGKAFFGWQWYWMNDDVWVLSYPEVFCGYSPFGTMGELGHTEGFPVRIGTHSFKSTFDIVINTSSVESRDIWDMAFDIWFLFSTSNPDNFGRLDIKAEMMIWLKYTNQLLFYLYDEPHDSFTNNGITYDYFRDPAFPDGNGVDGAHYFTAFLATTPVLSSDDFDITPFISYLIDNGVLTESDFLTTIELGTEVVKGRGEVIIRDYSVTVE